MENMVGYIFGSLKATENTLKDIDKLFKHQNTTNKRFRMFILSMTAWLYVHEFKHKEEKEQLNKKLDIQEKALDKLNDELRALRDLKGEAVM
jgi:hypothetical protein